MIKDITELTDEELIHCVEQGRLYGLELTSCMGFTPDEFMAEYYRREI